MRPPWVRFLARMPFSHVPDARSESPFRMSVPDVCSGIFQEVRPNPRPSGVPDSKLLIRKFLMKITCPHCSYAREMSEDRIPDGTLTARCPQCGERFQFSKEAAMRDAMREKTDDAECARAVRLGSRKEAARDDAQQGDMRQDMRQDKRQDMHWGAGQDEGDQGMSRGGGDGADGGEHFQDASRDGSRDGSHDDAHDEAYDQAYDGHDGPYDGHDGPCDGPYKGPYGGPYDGSGLSFNPWECARSLQEFVSAFFQTSLRVMFAASRFFSGIVPRSSLLALAFFLAVCLFQTVVEYLWGAIFFNWVMPITETTDPQLRHLGELLSSQYNLSVLLLRCVMLTAQLYIFAGILFLCWRLVLRGRVDFTVVLQVLCYAQAPLILCIIPGIGTLVGMLWCLVCTVVGFRAALRITWAQTVLGMLPLIMLILVSYAKFFSMLG